MTKLPSTHVDLPGAVLFDLDGTLIDSEHLWLRAQSLIMDELGAPWTPDDQAQCLGGSLDRVGAYMAQRAGDSSAAPDIAQRLLLRMEQLIRAEPLRWRPGAAELLREATTLGVPRALVTASWLVLVEASAEQMIHEMGASSFDVVVAGDQVGYGKPHAEPYLKAASLVGVPPNACLAIEDSPSGVASAVAAGCRVVAVPHMASVDEVLFGAKHAGVVDSLAGRTLPDLWRLVG